MKQSREARARLVIKTLRNALVKRALNTWIAVHKDALYNKLNENYAKTIEQNQLEVDSLIKNLKENKNKNKQSVIGMVIKHMRGGSIGMNNG